MPVDRGAIDAQLKDIGEGERWWEQREFRDLPYILNPDERIHGLVNAKLRRGLRPRVLPRPQWLVVATNQRLICLKRQRVGRQQMDILLGQITRMWHTTRLRGVYITLDTPHARHRLRVLKADAFRFIGALGALLAQAQPTLAGGGATQWLPAPPTGRISRLLGGFPSLPAPEYVTRADFDQVKAEVERLEMEMERMRQHVEFLENLVQKHTEATFTVAGRSAGA